MERVNSGNQWNAGGNDFLGKLVSLITESGCRYEGVVNFMNLDRSVIGLRNVIFFGTEERGRWDGLQVAPTINVFQNVLFRGDLIMHIEVIDIPRSPPNFVLDPVPPAMHVPAMMENINIGPPLPPPGLIQLPMHMIPCPPRPPFGSFPPPVHIRPPFGSFPPPVHIRPPFGSFPPPVHIRPPFGQSLPRSINNIPHFMYPILFPPVHNADLSIMQLEYYTQPICMPRPFDASTSQRRFNQPRNRNMGEPITQPSNLVVPGQGRGRGWGRSQGQGQVENQVEAQVEAPQVEAQVEAQVEDQVEAPQVEDQVQGLNLDQDLSLGLVQDDSLDLDLSRDLSQGQSLSPRVGMILGDRIWTRYRSRETSKFSKFFALENDSDDENTGSGSSDHD